MKVNELKDFLDEKVRLYNRPEFIATDPIQVPHRFTGKENIETAAFFTSSIAWGNRASIIKSANRLMELMENNPYNFIIHSTEQELQCLEKYVHRTFQGPDCMYFTRSLKNIYLNHGGLEEVIKIGYNKQNSVEGALSYLYSVFFRCEGERTRKHIANIENGASGKRLNMFLRWMIRSDSNGVDFGLWKNIPVSKLMLPLDIHSGRVARKLGLLKRKQNDWKAVEEVTEALRKLDWKDPVKYDFALFGLGIFEKF